MYLESITNIDEGDVIAFIDDLQFEYEGVHEITADEALTIDWVYVNKAQVTGSLIILDVTHQHTNWSTTYRIADHVKVIVEEGEWEE
jgi:hypothetical protein